MFCLTASKHTTSSLTETTLPVLVGLSQFASQDARCDPLYTVHLFMACLFKADQYPFGTTPLANVKARALLARRTVQKSGK